MENKRKVYFCVALFKDNFSASVYKKQLMLVCKAGELNNLLTNKSPNSIVYDRLTCMEEKLEKMSMLVSTNTIEFVSVEYLSKLAPFVFTGMIQDAINNGKLRTYIYGTTVFCHKPDFIEWVIRQDEVKLNDKE